MASLTLKNIKKIYPHTEDTKKAKKEIDRRARATWSISPVSRKKEDKTKYNRKRMPTIDAE